MREENRNIYVIGHVGSEGIKILIERKKIELSKYFSTNFLNKTYDKILKENDILSNFSANYEKTFCTTHIISIKNGGIYAALWDLAKRENVGMDFSQRDIPLYQETIEICHYFDILPYRLLSKNNYIIFENETCISDIERKYDNISIKCIGKLYNKKECARIDGDTKAYLTKDYKDEIDKIISGYIKHELV